jgi:hypothetical protein
MRYINHSIDQKKQRECTRREPEFFNESNLLLLLWAQIPVLSNDLICIPYQIKAGPSHAER